MGRRSRPEAAPEGSGKRIIIGFLGGLLAAGLMTMAVISNPKATIRAEFDPRTVTEVHLDESGDWLLFASRGATDMACQATGPDGTAAELSTPRTGKSGPHTATTADGTVMVAILEVQVPDPGRYAIACTGSDGVRLFAIGPPLHWLWFGIFLVGAILVIVSTALSVAFQPLWSPKGPWPFPPGWAPPR